MVDQTSFAAPMPRRSNTCVYYVRRAFTPGFRTGYWTGCWLVAGARPGRRDTRSIRRGGVRSTRPVSSVVYPHGHQRRQSRTAYGAVIGSRPNVTIATELTVPSDGVASCGMRYDTQAASLRSRIRQVAMACRFASARPARMAGKRRTEHEDSRGIRL